MLGLVATILAPFAMAGRASAANYQSPGVFCNAGDGVTTTTTYQARRFIAGYEGFQVGLQFWNMNTRRWVPIQWFPTGGAAGFGPNYGALEYWGANYFKYLTPGFYLLRATYVWYFASSASGPWTHDWVSIDANSYYSTGQGQTSYCDLVGTVPIVVSISSRSTPTARLRELLLSQRAAQPGELNSVLARSTAPKCFGRTPTVIADGDGMPTVGTNGSDVIIGTEKNDTIIGFGGDDYICGLGGTDGLAGVYGQDHLRGGTGDDAFLGGRGRDFIYGGTGSDIAEGERGADVLRGGGQTMDILAHIYSSKSVDVRFSSGIAKGQGVDRFYGFDTVIGSKFKDVLVGTRGSQWFVGYPGSDRISGGRGLDGIFFTLSTSPVQVDLAASTSQGTGEGRDNLSGLEIVFGSPYDDTIKGTRDYNIIFGDKGNDIINGRRGGDAIDGGAGSDSCALGLTYLACENHDGPPELPPPPAVDVPPPPD
jgi:Ca2+-binding RTX toxin-like protein